MSFNDVLDAVESARPTAEHMAAKYGCRMEDAWCVQVATALWLWWYPSSHVPN